MRIILILFCFSLVFSAFSQPNSANIQFWVIDLDSSFSVHFYPPSGTNDSLQWKVEGTEKLLTQKRPHMNFADTGTYKIELFSMDDESKSFYYTATLKLSHDSLSKIHPKAFQCGYACGNGYDLCFSSSGVANFHAMIFNRWGEIMHESTEDFTWEKRNQKTGQLVQSDTYVYMLTWTDKNGNHQRFTSHWTYYR